MNTLTKETIIQEEPLPVTLPSIDIATFRENPTLANSFPFILQLKGFNRAERLHRTITHDPNSRPIQKGGLFFFEGLPKTNILDESLAAQKLFIPDPRGITISKDRTTCYVASVDTVYTLHLKEQPFRLSPLPFTSERLAFIHSVTMTDDEHHMLITSAGFDTILEFNLQTHACTWKWCAWDHESFNINQKGRRMPYRTAVLPDSPLGLAPNQRTAFPNSAIYKDHATILATLFHDGLIQIDKKTGTPTRLLSALQHPHAILPYEDGYIVSDTANGRAIILDPGCAPKKILHFSHMQGLDPQAYGREWLQQTKPFQSFLLGIDSNRMAIVILNIEDRQYRKIHMPPHWVVQEIQPM